MSRSILLVATVSSLALAQPKVEETAGAAIHEIERGFFFEARGGFWGTFNPPATSQVLAFSAGQAAEVSLGFDIGERLSLGAFVLGTANRNSSSYTGYSGGTSSGDYGALVPGATVKVRLVGFADDQDEQRTWLYVRAAGGAVFYSPRALINRLDVLVGGGVGVEYFTRLRHFSVGVEANVQYMVMTSSVAISILPAVKYSF